MQARVRYFLLLSMAFAMQLISCKSSETAELQADEEVAPRTPVTITTVQYGPIEDYVELNATSAYLQKSYVKANLTGYVKSVSIRFGSSVNKGQSLFALKTKESEALGNTINQLDAGFKFSGVNYVRSSVAGFVTELNHQAGDYVQDGEQLAVISDNRSFMFLLDLPYEYKAYATTNKQVEVTLPGGERLQGNVQTSMPFIDSLSQTQAVAIKVKTQQQIPPGLVAKVKIIKIFKATTTSLPKAAVLSDETQSAFWVMKMINDSTAIKVPVKTGIETGGKIEILSPDFSAKDKVILTGNFGLPDTALVVVPPQSSKGDQ